MPPRALVAGLLAAASLACSGRPATEDALRPPSVLLVTIDTLRADHVGCYGDAAAQTPQLDRLAAEGVRFDEARSHVPLTAPSHATILTGVLPPRHGVRDNGPFRLRPDTPTLAEAFRRAGYRTAAVVASVVLDRATGLDRGFESYDDNQRRGPRSAFQYLERGASQVEEASRRALEQLQPPFFLWVHFYDPHAPWVAPPPFAERQRGRGYDAEIAFADAALGSLLEVARARAGRDLVVAAVADHGESLGDHGENQHGYTLHRGVLRVPLILAGPGIPRGRTVSATVGLVDLAPTLAELAHVDLPGATGRSLARFWRDGAAREGEPAADLWEETLHPLFDSGWAPLRGLLEGRWHLVDAPRAELYDRRADADDRTDLASRRPETVEELRARLRALGESLGDESEPAAAPVATPEERERLEKLASLGYVSNAAGAAPAGGRLDPKDGLPGFLAVEQAERLVELGEGARARDLLAPFLQRDPANPRLWHTVSKARMLLGDLDGAEAAIQRSLALAPGLEFLRYTHAQILKRRGDEAAVRAELEAILRDNPRSVDASLELSAMAIRRNDRPASKTILRAAYEAGARDPDLLDRLGQHGVLEGRDSEARQFFAQALDLWPEDPVALLAAGRADLRANDPAKAIERLRGCVTGPNAFECRIELARAYVVGPRDLASARRELVEARALATDPKVLLEVERRLAALDGMAR
ncbi:MAG TPA: sulfatase-like hydrolase/transferase [Candidatus Polarisedimenticolaceae bacterium]|nr:sulfatase-like hydrolase/transferase [Candidatus Polarisedimenticolaceae bacterium]